MLPLFRAVHPQRHAAPGHPGRVLRHRLQPHPQPGPRRQPGLGGRARGRRDRPRPPRRLRDRVQAEAAAVEAAHGRGPGDHAAHVRLRHGQRLGDRALGPRRAAADELPDPGDALPPAHPRHRPQHPHRGAQGGRGQQVHGGVREHRAGPAVHLGQQQHGHQQAQEQVRLSTLILNELCWAGL